MKRLHFHSLITAAAALSLLSASPLWAAERPGGGTGGLRQQPMSPPPQAPATGRDPMPAPVQGQRSLPAPGIAGPAGSRQPAPETRIPAAAVTHRGTRYVVSGGQWYEQRGGDLVAVEPPANVQVQVLPDGYTMRWIGGVPYFVADGLYYVWRERTRRYEIVPSPQAEEAAALRDLRIDTSREPAPGNP